MFHVFESEVRDQVPGDAYEAQVALMEMSLDRDAISVARSAAHRRDELRRCGSGLGRRVSAFSASRGGSAERAAATAALRGPSPDPFSPPTPLLAR